MPVPLLPEDPNSFLETAFKLICAAFAGIASWLWAGIVSDMKAMREDITAVKDDLSSSKIYNEREFEKRESTQLSLARIHDRLDQLFQVVGEKDTRHGPR